MIIVGSGPAGLTLAAELAASGRDILVVESGGRLGEHPQTSALNEIESIGAPRVMDQSKVRNRILGGSSHTWSGRCAPLDPIDYEARPWLPHSGWPVTQDALAPYFAKAGQHLGLVDVSYDGNLFSELNLPRRFAGEDGSALRAVFGHFSRGTGDYVRFGPRFAQLNLPKVRVLTHATVTHITTGPNGAHVESLEIAAPGGKRRRVAARCFVLCGGGIENARMLLASDRVDPRGVGNARDLVGRFLMDHPRERIGGFAPEALRALQGEFLLQRHPSGARMQRGWSLRDAVQRREGLLNCAAWLTQHIADDDVWQALGALRRGRGARLLHARHALRHADQAIHGAWRRLRHGEPLPRRFKRLDLDVMVEQVPNPESRITLSDRRDPLGVPISRIDWKLGLRERETVIRLGHAVHDALQQAGLPTPELVDWVRDRRPEEAVLHDPAHPLGTTRMAACSCHGVVDRDLKVFGIDNLYIAGSSVFPTGGHANPTLTIVALALRLAETLKRSAPPLA